MFELNEEEFSEHKIKEQYEQIKGTGGDRVKLNNFYYNMKTNN